MHASSQLLQPSAKLAFARAGTMTRRTQFKNIRLADPIPLRPAERNRRTLALSDGICLGAALISTIAILAYAVLSSAISDLDQQMTFVAASRASSSP